MILRRRLLMAGGIPFLLSACSPAAFLLPRSPRLFQLTPKSTFDVDLPLVKWQLVIETPTAPAAIDTVRIALTRSAIDIDYFAEVSWIDRAPLMLQALMLESFENSQRIVAVGRSIIGLRADFVLRTELRTFQAVYEPGHEFPFASVRIVARLVRMPRRAIEAFEDFSAISPAEDQSFPALINAFDDSLGTVFKRLVGWTIRQGEASTLRAVTP